MFFPLNATLNKVKGKIKQRIHPALIAAGCYPNRAVGGYARFSLNLFEKGTCRFRFGVLFGVWECVGKSG